MSKQEILTKAIELAIAGGYVPVTGERQDDLSIEWLAKEYCNNSDGYTLFSLIYNHEFAKCLWGESMVYLADGCPIGEHKALVDQDESPYYEPHGEAYKYHLQQMVIADDPIAYLGEHI